MIHGKRFNALVEKLKIIKLILVGKLYLKSYYLNLNLIIGTEYINYWYVLKSVFFFNS